MLKSLLTWRGPMRTFWGSHPRLLRKPATTTTIDSDSESEENGTEPRTQRTPRNFPGNAGVIQYLLAESAALDSLASFGDRTKQCTWGLNLCLYHEDQNAVIRGISIFDQVLCRVRLRTQILVGCHFEPGRGRSGVGYLSQTRKGQS